MRTKNAKRLWPVPATLAVVALAALLAFGLMATTGAQPAAAQEGADCEVTVTAEGALTPMPEDCATFGDTATVKFTGPAEVPGSEDDEPIRFYVLSEDKSGSLLYYKPATVYQGNEVTFGTAPNEVTKRRGFYDGDAEESPDVVTPGKYTSHTVDVPRAEVVGGGYKAQSVTITVSGSFHIYSTTHFGLGTPPGYGEAVPCQILNPSGSSYGAGCDQEPVVSTPSGAAQRLRESNTDDQQPASTESVTVTFLGAPSLTQDDVMADDDINVDDDASSEDNAMDANKNDDTDPSSAIGAFDKATPDNDDVLDNENVLWMSIGGIGGVDDALVDAIPSVANEDVFIVAEIRDNNGVLLKGGDDVDSAVTFTVVYTDGSDLKTVARTQYSEPVEVDETGRASIELTGWTVGNDTGPVKVTVSASYTGPSGTLGFEDVVLSRVSDPTMLNTGTYVCAMVLRAQGTKPVTAARRRAMPVQTHW